VEGSGAAAAEHLPTFVLAGDRDPRQVKRLVDAGRLRPFSDGIYTSDLKTPLAELGRQEWLLLVSKLCPGAVLVGRTGLEYRLADDGSCFVSSNYYRNVELPGVIVRQVKAPGPLEGEIPYLHGLFFPSRPRAYLENLAFSRARSWVPRTVGRVAIEEQLGRIAARGGRNELKETIDHARRLAPQLGAERELELLEAIIGGLLAALDGRPSDVKLEAPAAIAVQRQAPYDARRVERFQILASALLAEVGGEGLRMRRPMTALSDRSFVNASFFDAYFSNYIEGTRFTVEEAAKIIFEGVTPIERPKDAHDIRGTYELVGNLAEMSKAPEDADAFIALMRQRHLTMMRDRPEISPGLFKSRENQAGSTIFVHPDLVLGTLRAGFDFMRPLQDPFARAIYAMFLVAEVHPFNDGNGRSARTMMNGELVRASETRIIIPSVYRNEYLNSLRLLSNHNDPVAFIRVMAAAQKFTASIDFEDFERAKAMLTAANAFEEPSDKVRLLIPN